MKLEIVNYFKNIDYLSWLSSIMGCFVRYTGLPLVIYISLFIAPNGLSNDEVVKIFLVYGLIQVGYGFFDIPKKR